MLPEAELGTARRGCGAVPDRDQSRARRPGALDKIASGGELSRLMLALKVVLTGGGAVETLVFDEVDSGIGGATAAAVGERLARVARGRAGAGGDPSPAGGGARGGAVARGQARGRRTARSTVVEVLDAAERREEIARMLAGEFVTDAARDAADEPAGGRSAMPA